MSARSWNPANVDVLRYLLIALAGLFVLGGFVSATLSLLTAQQGTAMLPLVFGAILILFGCFVAAMGLLVLAAILRLLALQLRQAQFAQTALENIQQSILLLQESVQQLPPQINARTIQPLATTPVLMEGDDTARQTLAVLTELRDLMTLTEAQRLERGRQRLEQRKGELAQAVRNHLTVGEWSLAEARIAELRGLAPEDPSVQELSERIAAEQAGRLHQALEAARSRLRHLMSITAWTQAEEVVRSLSEQFPQAPEVRAMAEELGRERDAFEKEHFQRLFLDLRDATDHRQWRRAYQTAEELLRRYPSEKRVERLRADIGTLRENAEAQERREQEELFKDLLKRQRYEDALSVARSVMERYPTSSSAAELSKLLPKVEELIRQRHQAPTA